MGTKIRPFRTVYFKRYQKFKLNFILNYNYMENFKITLLNRSMLIYFDNPNFVQAKFKAQKTSFACQGQWGNEVISIPKKEYSLEKLIEKINSYYNISFY